ncbi:MAG: hypothetical protein M3Y87_23125 [Myxococcota bacterium]|nr:hypothetical protein [Myxococcota bacterium]
MPTFVRARGLLVLIAACAVGLLPARAQAYLMDANDARTLDPGALEMEVQPLGYFHVLTEDGDEHSLVAPSLMLYLGIDRGVDLIFLTRGFFLVDEVPDATRYRTWESTIALRVQLVPGRYSTDGIDGPSLVLQAGVMLPNVSGQGEHPGAQLGLLLGQQWDAGTLHANVFATYTTWNSFDLFVAVAMEGPPDWSVRPLVEVWYDHDTFYGELLSGLVGLYVDANEHLTLELGGRIGAWDGYTELEARLSMWCSLPNVWGGAPEADTDEDTPDGARPQWDRSPAPLPIPR